MKVLMVSPFPGQPGQVNGGVEAAASRLATAMWTHRGLSYDVLVYEDQPESSYDDWPHAHVLPHRAPRVGGRTSAPAMRRLIRRLAASGDYDVVHIQGPASFATGSANEVVTIHGISERDSLYGAHRLQGLRAAALRLRETRGRRRVSNFIAVSDYAATVLRGAAEPRIWTIPNPVDPLFFSGPARRPPSKTVVFAGRVVEIKNVLGLIRGFASAWRQDPTLRLRIVGHGADTPYGRLCAQEAGALPDGVVTFVGLATVTGLKEELSRAALLALFSWQENAPMVVAEAHASGVPVVSAEVGGVAEMVSADNGALVAPGDEDGLGRAIVRLTRWDLSGERADRVRDSAARYRPEAVTSATFAAYREVAAPRV
jgi:glycosyltransferase involved in cell wall biosynthesis